MNHSVQVVRDYLLTLQQQICSTLEQEEAVARFRVDEWEYGTGGGGCTRVLEGGNTLEKAGVNFSYVLGQNLPPSATHARPELIDTHFEAVGVSLVLHPQNPFVPTTHLNLRYFVATKPKQDPVWWFGGGFDLTPYYGFVDDCKHWHLTAKKVCDPFGFDVYPRLKKWCDEYFYLKHRDEPRGIGGIFFDDLNEWPWQRCFDFIKSVGNAFLEAYLPILQKRKSTSFEEHHKVFQKIRRGRYAEFNLIYDRGTLFGLQLKGRTESILMSLPPEVAWCYDYKPRPGSPEQELYEVFLRPRDWVKA